MIDLEKTTVSQLRQAAFVLGVGPDELLQLLTGSGSQVNGHTRSPGAPARGAAPPKPGPQKKPGASPWPASARAQAPTSQEWNVRTESGRKALEEAILVVMRELKAPGLATHIREEVRKRTGKSVHPNQFRQRVNELIDRGEVTYEGEKAGMRYSLI